MADEPNTPKRKRRRWLILAVVLVSLVSWWYWPRGDARFVGRWTLHAVNGQPPKYQEEFTYYRNGLLVHTVAGGTPSVFIWSVRDEHLEFRLQGKTILEAALAPMHRVFAEKILGRPQPQPVPIRYRISAINNHEMFLHDEDDEGRTEDVIQSRRIPE